MMKKTLILAIAAVVALGSVASATTEIISTTLYAGSNLVSVPQVPIYPDPRTVFVDDSGSQLPIDGNLTKWDSVGQGYIAFANRRPLEYGGVLLGDAAWFTSDADVLWQYEAAPNGLKTDAVGDTMVDMWISLPAAGTSLFGTPFNSSILWSDVMITNGEQMASINEAVANGWFDGTCTGWDAVGQGYVTVGPGRSDAKTLDPWQGYWIQTNVDNLALIIPAPAN